VLIKEKAIENTGKSFFNPFPCSLLAIKFAIYPSFLSLHIDASLKKSSVNSASLVIYDF